MFIFNKMPKTFNLSGLNFHLQDVVQLNKLRKWNTWISITESSLLFIIDHLVVSCFVK